MGDNVKKKNRFWGVRFGEQRGNVFSDYKEMLLFTENYNNCDGRKNVRGFPTDDEALAFARSAPIRTLLEPFKRVLIVLIIAATIGLAVVRVLVSGAMGVGAGLLIGAVGALWFLFSAGLQEIVRAT